MVSGYFIWSVAFNISYHPEMIKLFILYLCRDPEVTSAHIIEDERMTRPQMSTESQKGLI